MNSANSSTPGMNPVDQFPRTRCSPLTSPHLKRSRRGSIRSSMRTNGDSRGNVAVEFYRAGGGHTTRVARSRGLKARTCHLRVRERRSVSKIANDEIPPYQRTATLFSDLEHISRSSSSAAKLLAHSSRRKLSHISCVARSFLEI